MKSIINYSIAIVLFLLLNASTVFSQRSIYEPLNIDDVTFDFDDFGTMWTFDAVPVAKYKSELNFEPTQEWLDDVQKSALQIGGGCSASFVSEDGLIMTNHHCVRGRLKDVENEGENIYKNGFYAEKLEEERRFPGLYVDQLMSITDVTAEIHGAMEQGKDEKEKIDIKFKKIKEIEERHNEKTGLTCKVITLYNGGKYSLYAYKRYNDIRLVMVPDVQIAATGWDWDNFTYPRYELDFAFLRAYDENGKPVKAKHYFGWSEKGAETFEPVFVIGRPGNTDRLMSMAQLDYFKRIRHPQVLHRLNEVYHAYFQYFKKHPDKQAKLLSRLLTVANGRKAYAGMLEALNDEYLMKKKKDFEEKLITKVRADQKLNAEYGDIWGKLALEIRKLEEIQNEELHLGLSNYYASAYHQTARNIVKYALEEDDEKRKQMTVFVESEENELDELLVVSHQTFLTKVKGKDCKLLTTLFGGKTDKEAYNFFINNTEVDNKEFVEKLVKKGARKILKTEDPLIKYYIEVNNITTKNQAEKDRILSTIDVLNQKLGLLIFKVYGSKIPPDATSTLRISHGKIEGYEYNGTIAPAKTTYFGLWDRYYSFGEKDYPWGLHEKWKKVPAGLDLSTAIGFSSTNDIVGGNSGSAVINVKRQVVGLVHDGNLESLAGSYAFLREDNRAVSTDSHGLMESLKHVYKTKALIYELENGKLK